MAVNLRWYQQQAKDSTLAYWESGGDRALVVLPTGTGKTVVFSHVTEERVKQGGRVLIVAHRKELLQQAQDKLQMCCNLPAFMEIGPKADCLKVNSPIVISSVPTMNKRLYKFPSDYFDTIIVDEAHHSASNSYMKLLNHFPSAKVLGVTATPIRGDKQDLYKIYDKMVFEYKLLDAIREGFLCDMKVKKVPLKIDISKVSIDKGDYKASDLDKVLNQYLRSIASEMAKYCVGKRTVVFMPLIETSKRFRTILQECGIDAVEVNGDSDNREQVLDSFHQGQIPVMCNVNLLTEGWDCPSVDCIVVLRPTKSKGLYQQMVGRGLRLSQNTGKKNLLLLDFMWESGKRGVCDPSCLLTDNEKEMEKIRKRIAAGSDEDLSEMREGAARDIVAERKKKLLEELEANRRKAEEEERRQAEEERRRKYYAEQLRARQNKLLIRGGVTNGLDGLKEYCKQAIYSGKVDPIVSGYLLKDYEIFNFDSNHHRRYEMYSPSDKQKNYVRGLSNGKIDVERIYYMGLASILIEHLKRRKMRCLSSLEQIIKMTALGIDYDTETTSSKAEELIQQASTKLPATEKQVSTLLRMGYKDPEKLTKTEATEIISIAAKNRWKLPEEYLLVS